MNNKLTRVIAVIGCLTACLPLAARADIVGVGAFSDPVVIDFEGLTTDVTVGATYSGSGVTFTNLCGGQQYNTGTGNGYSSTGHNFGCTSISDVTAVFSNAISRVGMFITTNDGDDTRISAYLGSMLVGFEVFDTSGGGSNGSFAGVSFNSVFDSIVIDTFGPVNGAFAIDDFRFNVASVPEPATLLLLGLGLAGVGLSRRNKGGVAASQR